MRMVIYQKNNCPIITVDNVTVILSISFNGSDSTIVPTIAKRDIGRR